MFRLAVLLGLMLLFAEAGAQTQTEFGLKAGVNMARMTSGSGYSDYLFGLNAGFYFRGTNPLTVQLEMLYSGQGGGFVDPVTGQKVERRLHYMTPTLLLRYQPAATIGLLIGPQLGILIVAREGSNNISDNYDPMDLGLNVGADYDLERWLNLSFRFYQSMRNVGNQVFQVSVGYRIQRRY